MSDLSRAKIAVVHDWLIDYAGSERVLAQILRCLPHAVLFTLVDRMPPSERAPLAGRRATTTFLQNMPGIVGGLKYYLPLMPIAIEQLDVTGFDLVISSNHAVAKGVIASPDALHVCYINSPMRYAWDQQFAYLEGEGTGPHALLRLLLHRLRLWDHRSSAGVDRFIANSRFIARRVLKAYRRESEVVYPPVDTDHFVPGNAAKEARSEEYVTVSRLMPYKRVDLIIEAFARMPERKLTVIGDGPDYRRLKAAAPPNVAMPGYLPTAAVLQHLQRARAFLYAAVEDFGIAPIEALACGTPVIALRRGGAAESVAGLDAEHPSGVFFEQPSADAIVRAVETFEANGARITSAACRARAETFSESRFRERFSTLVEGYWSEWQECRRSGDLSAFAGARQHHREQE